MANREQLRQLRELDRLARVRADEAQAEWGRKVLHQQAAEEAENVAAQKCESALSAWQDSLQQLAPGLARLYAQELLDRERAVTGAHLTSEAASREADEAKTFWQSREALRQAGERQLQRDQRRAQQARNRKQEQAVEEQTASKWFSR